MYDDIKQEQRSLRHTHVYNGIKFEQNETDETHCFIVGRSYSCSVVFEFI